MTDDPRNESRTRPFRDPDDNSYPVFRKEIEFIARRREQMGAVNRAAKLKHYPTTENGLVGLCFSGGGIRSATFNLGFLQALYKHGILQRADYLSTVSGGGYIGSCLTSLLNSDLPEDAAGAGESEQSTGHKTCGNPLWQSDSFPFSNPTQSSDAEGPGPCPDGCTLSGSQALWAAEKAPALRLRYFSSYLTAEGGPIRKVMGPVLAVARGLLFNFLLIVPVILCAGLLLALLYQAPAVTVGNVPLYFTVEGLKSALEEQRRAHTDYDNYIYNHSDGPCTGGLSNCVSRLEADPSHALALDALQERHAAASAKVRSQWKAMLTIPLAALTVTMLCAFVVIQGFGNLESRFQFSRVFSTVLFAGLVLGAVQVFGAAIVYWNHWQVPNLITVVSVVTFLGPRLAKASKKGTRKNPWMTLALSIVLMSLTPLILLYCTGWLVHYLLSPESAWALVPALKPIAPRAVIFWTALTAMLFYITNRWININKISLHNFYRDRLSRAFMIRLHTSADNGDRSAGRDRPEDHQLLSRLYDGPHNVGPYPIINANLNRSRKMPDASQDGVLRNCESFIFSKFWCGSKQTGYVETPAYEAQDPHIDLATAMAISGAAANVGMGQVSNAAIRLLLGLLNVRLGYWAANPKRSQGPLRDWLLGKSPGGMLAMSEWIGRYDTRGGYINLSDGGHFDNLGVYEMLRRRCKYIIVGDAEADPKMQFQALAYIIRMARIDFGIDIEIDVSSLEPGKDSGLSRQHCTVGIVKYPANAVAGEERGYLLYCKSSLSGDEPQHLREYQIDCPTFPHQTTADQWFDERQFEVYRELGFHVGNTTFKPLVRIDADTSMEEVFIQTKEFWTPRSMANEKRFTQHACELNRIMEIIKDDASLAFMDDQIYPEWQTFMGDVARPGSPNLWLPQSAVELRAGFYVCNLMLQLMENVYLDLNLEYEHDHPDNRGWMNLFKHWSWAGIFQVSWAISACTYGAKFQHFCALRLGLDIKNNVELETIWAAASPAGLQDQLLQAAKSSLNALEMKEIIAHLDREQRMPSRCLVFKLTVRSPLTDDANKAFCFGVALLAESEKRVEIDYFRVQDHLRRMGLGRRSLEALVKDILHRRAAGDSPAQRRAVLENIKLAPWIAEWEGADVHRQFDSLLTSVIAAVGAGG